MASSATGISETTLAGWVRDSWQRVLDLVADLADEQLLGPRLEIVNPLLWEIGHVAWFAEKWILRGLCGQPPARRDADALYDSTALTHDTRWNLPLPPRQQTIAYFEAVRDRVLEQLNQPASPALIYFAQLIVFHADMHTEAFTYTRQTLGYPPPWGQSAVGSRQSAAGRALTGPLAGDAEVPGGRFLLGATGDEPFVFDNEKWAHPVEVKPFAMARAAVTQAEFAEFVEAGGYRQEKHWSPAGWQWRGEAGAEQPVYWKREPGRGWQRRDFDRWLPLEPHRPVLHVNWYEADAYCRWAGRRLPTEAEWELAASDVPKRRYPWGNDPASSRLANLDWAHPGAVEVADFAEGDSACGCRQMIGNVWEWTASDFLPYPGFVPDPYREYSQPWFGTHKALRGGCWATRARLIRNTWRNFYTPDRRDVWAGFRTCRTIEASNGQLMNDVWRA